MSRCTVHTHAQTQRLCKNTTSNTIVYTLTTGKGITIHFITIHFDTELLHYTYCCTKLHKRMWEEKGVAFLGPWDYCTWQMTAPPVL